MRRLVVVIAALVAFASIAETQQVGVLTHNATLRSGPSSSSGKVGALQAGAAVTLLGNGHREEATSACERRVRMWDGSLSTMCG